MSYVSNIISGIALVVSVVSCHIQNRIPADDLTISNNSHYSAIDIVEIYNNAAPNLRGGFSPVIGPMKWNIQVYNPTNRTVSLANFKVRYIAKDGTTPEYSRMQPVLAERNGDSAILPISIPSGEVRTYTLSLFVPIDPTEKQKDQCLEDGQSLHEIEVCFAANGTDIYGNRLTYSSQEALGSVLHSYSYDAMPLSPQFIIDIETGDKTIKSDLLSSLM